MMDKVVSSFLGTGWAFPPSFDKNTATVKMVDDEQDIAESLKIILSTIVGERLMQPEFGCDIHRLVFEQIDSNLVSALNHAIYYALLNYEPRIDFLDLLVLNQDAENGILYLQINYAIIITNTRHNIVFPFYLIEGTNLSQEKL